MSNTKKRRASCLPAYAYVLKTMYEWDAANPNATPEDRDRKLGEACQTTINRRLSKCLPESARVGDQTRRRYALDTGRGTIYLRVPRWVSPRKLRAVLSRELPDADPNRAGERERAQAIVDDWFPGRWVTFDINCGVAPNDSDPVSNAMRNEIKACALIQVVAVGMAASVGQQRLSIRRLGAERLQQMVTRILEDCIVGTYSPNAVAREFGLHPSNVSHFAPRKWRRGDKTPDLWAYVFDVAKRYPALLGALQDAMPAHLAGAGDLSGHSPGAAASDDVLHSETLEQVTLLLDRISARSMGEHVDRPISIGLVQGAPGLLRDRSKDLVDVISARYAVLLRSVGSPPISPDAPAVREDAVALVERIFQWDGGYAGALAEAKTTGPSRILNAMTDRFRSEERLRYAHRVFKELFVPLDWQNKVALVKAFLAQAWPLLPPEIRSRRPEHFVRHWETLVDAYVQSVDKVKGVLRSL